MLFITHDIEEAVLLADRVCVMTARPGRIKKSIEVRMPRPRSIELTTSPEFNALRREVLELIRQESLRAAMERVWANSAATPSTSASSGPRCTPTGRPSPPSPER